MLDSAAKELPAPILSRQLTDHVLMAAIANKTLMFHPGDHARHSYYGDAAAVAREAVRSSPSQDSGTSALRALKALTSRFQKLESQSVVKPQLTSARRIGGKQIGRCFGYSEYDHLRLMC